MWTGNNAVPSVLILAMIRSVSVFVVGSGFGGLGGGFFNLGKNEEEDSLGVPPVVFALLRLRKLDRLDLPRWPSASAGGCFLLLLGTTAAKLRRFIMVGRCSSFLSYDLI